jgi:anaerobic nitric oxide reductase transcription regulator
MSSNNSIIQENTSTPENIALGSINLREETDRFQRKLIGQTLIEESGNWAAAARKLSTDRANLNRIAKRLNIKVVKSVIES